MSEKLTEKLLINLTEEQRSWLRKQPEGAAAKIRRMIANEMKLDKIVLNIFGERKEDDSR